MADTPKNPNNDPVTSASSGQSSKTPSSGAADDRPAAGATSKPASAGSSGTGSAGASSAGSASRPSGASSSPTGSAGSSASRPRPAVNRSGDGYPEVDTLSFDPEEADWVGQTRRWIEENPGMAIAAAAAAGLLVGRLVAALIPEPEPQTFSDKVEARARELAKQGRYAANDAGDVVSKQLAIAADALSEASVAVGKGAKKGFDEAKDFGEFLAETIGQTVAERASKWLDKR